MCNCKPGDCSAMGSGCESCGNNVDHQYNSLSELLDGIFGGHHEAEEGEMGMLIVTKKKGDNHDRS